ncbi:RNA-directed DNA polymerase from mobile element jockey [Eumeta japonica]|uniref:RNA-directed DNA polymerase from mobile element jockey n=1 Tax=Eumeta variegata TaxID=151549 RepID=A0A4C1V506_EUMVA|nr:RNA-directed DNA polymerase from mobile element jockey [Eumeta japonica]
MEAVRVSQRTLYNAPVDASTTSHGREHNRGRRTVGVFLAIEKAFDRVWHSRLLFKLIDNQIPPALVRTVASFLKDRDF